MNTYSSTVMNHLNLIKFNILRVTPQHGQHKVVHVRYWLVLVLEVHVQKVLYRHVHENKFTITLRNSHILIYFWLNI